VAKLDRNTQLTGMSVINHHTLSDFRTEHGAALEELFVEVLGVLSSEELVDLKRVMHDGMKVKAFAGRIVFVVRLDCKSIWRPHGNR